MNKWIALLIVYTISITSLLLYKMSIPVPDDPRLLDLQIKLNQSLKRQDALLRLSDSLDIMLINQNYLYVTTKHNSQTIEAEFNKLKNDTFKKIHTNNNAERDSLAHLLFPADSLWH